MKSNGIEFLQLSPPFESIIRRHCTNVFKPSAQRVAQCQHLPILPVRLTLTLRHSQTQCNFKSG
eukprot:scaffold405_cov179-Ochromonas_danica.AAC.3